MHVHTCTELPSSLGDAQYGVSHVATHNPHAGQDACRRFPLGEMFLPVDTETLESLPIFVTTRFGSPSIV